MDPLFTGSSHDVLQHSGQCTLWSAICKILVPFPALIANDSLQLAVQPVQQYSPVCNAVADACYLHVSLKQA